MVYFKMCYLNSQQLYFYLLLITGLGKKIDKLGKKKACIDVLKWKKSVINHLFWCVSSTDDGKDEQREARWLSITNHIMNKHSGHGRLFKKCTHGRLTGRERKKKWLKPGEC